MLIIIFDEMHVRISKCFLQEFNFVIDINSQKSNFKNHQVIVLIKIIKNTDINSTETFLMLLIVCIESDQKEMCDIPWHQCTKNDGKIVAPERYSVIDNSFYHLLIALGLVCNYYFLKHWVQTAIASYFTLIVGQLGVFIPELKYSNKSTLALSLVSAYSFGKPSLRIIQARIEN